jgi:hypothetical protein
MIASFVECANYLAHPYSDFLLGISTDAGLIFPLDFASKLAPTPAHQAYCLSAPIFQFIFF